MNAIEQQLQNLRQQMMLMEAQKTIQTPQLEGATAWRGMIESGEARAIGAGVVFPQAWDASFVGDELTCSGCVYMRGPVTIDTGDKTLDLTGETDVYVAANVDLYAGTVTLALGASVAAVTDATVQNADDTEKVLLYHVVKTGGVWAVVMDYRKMMQLGVRL